MKEKTLIKRNKEIKVRLTEEEHQALLERMEGGELATWIRNTCLDEKPNKRRNYKRKTVLADCLFIDINLDLKYNSIKTIKTYQKVL